MTHLLDWKKYIINKPLDGPSCDLRLYSKLKGKFHVLQNENKEKLVQALEKSGANFKEGTIVILKELNIIAAYIPNDENISARVIRKIGANLFKKAKQFDYKNITLSNSTNLESYYELLVEGVVFASYEFDFFKTEKSPKFYFNIQKEMLLKKQLQNIARFLIDLPANHCTPKLFCDYASEMIDWAKEVTNSSLDFIINKEEFIREKKNGPFLICC